MVVVVGFAVINFVHCLKKQVAFILQTRWAFSEKIDDNYYLKIICSHSH